MQIVEIVIANYIYIIICFSYHISYMLYDFMQDGMIFSFYGNWLKKEINYNKFVDIYNQKEDTKILMEKVELKSWKKPLGLCLKCFHVWINILIILISYFLLNQNFNFFIFTICMAYSYTKLAEKYYE